MLGRQPETDARYPGPTIKDWAVVLIGLGFVALGLWVSPGKPEALGLVAFFGAIAAVGLWNVVRKLRAAKLRPLSVEVLGGVPLRPSRLRMGLLGGGIFGVGLALLTVPNKPIIILVCIAVMIAAGGFVLGAVLLGKLPVGFLQFDEAGLTVGQRNAVFTIGWDNIAAVWPGELHDNATLFLNVHDLGAVDVRPPEAKQQVIRSLLSSQAWVRAHVIVMTETYGLDLPLLVAAIEGYVREPESRARLAVRRLAS